MSEDRLWGRVTRMQSGFITVETDQGDFVCRLRGRLKQGPAEGDIVALGDWVEVSPQPDGSGMIGQVAERESALTRTAPTDRGPYQQVLLANPDQAVLVFAAANPTPRLRMLDRFLIICEKERIPALIVANKTDLTGRQTAAQLFSIYPPIGYPVVITSAKTGLGVEELRERLTGKISVLAGPSGVGKSSLLNAIQPELGLKVGRVGRESGRGRHTTQVGQLFRLDSGGYVADLPGLRSVSLWDIEPYELDGYFPEISPLVHLCAFSDCTHLSEPGCAVRAAVEEGQVSEERYDSYLRLRFGE